MSERHVPKVAIMVSGSGSTAEAFIHATQDGRVDAEVGLIVCNNPPEKAAVYQRVVALNDRYGLQIETRHISGETHPKGSQGRGQTLAESEAIAELLIKGRFDHVAMMGYMRIVRGALLEEYGWKPEFSSIYQARMTNTHPGPLPETRDTYGIHASKRVLDLGLVASTHTFHLVAAGVDEGPILAEHPVEVAAGDSPESLFERVQTVEKAALPYALGKFLQDQKKSFKQD